MSLKKHKIYLIKKDLSVPKMARQLANDKRPYESTRVMIWQMLSGTHFYPKLAEQLQETFGIAIKRPKSTNTRQVLKQAA